MKNIFGTLLTIAVVMLMVGMLYAEEVTDEAAELIKLNCSVYYGKVIKLGTTIVPLSEIIHSNIPEGHTTEEVILPPYTVTIFGVVQADGEFKKEIIENGNGKDMSAMIAVVQEAFTSGEMIQVVKCYEPVQPLYDKLDALNTRKNRLFFYEFYPKVRELRNWFYSLPEVKKLQELYSSKQISLEEYTKRCSELCETTGYNAKYTELKTWYLQTKDELTDQIASLEADIEYILNNPKLRSVSIDKGAAILKRIPTEQTAYGLE